MSIFFQPFKAAYEAYHIINHGNKFNSLKLKKLLLIIVPVLILFTSSCGLLEPGGGMNPPPPLSYVFKIYSVNSDGSNLKLLINSSEFHLSLTRDTIFYLYKGGIYSMNLDGTNQHLITPPDFSCSGFWLSVDGQKIYTGKYNSPYYLNTDGSGLTRLNFQNSLRYSYEWAVSPSGTLIAVSMKTGLFLINPDGSNLKLLKDSSNSTTFSNLNFTYDGNSIIYIQDEYYGGNLKLFNIKNGIDTTLFAQTSDDHIIAYEVAPWNSIVFTDIAGVNLASLIYYTHFFLTKGSYAHYSIDGTRISYVILDNISLYTFNLNSKKVNSINVDLPGNYISDSFLSGDNSKIIFSADSSYTVKNN